jgi:hypothetical protein
LEGENERFQYLVLPKRPLVEALKSRKGKKKKIFNLYGEENPKGATAMCPFCYVDSVIGSKSGYPIDDPGFLEEMYLHWF